MKKKNRREFLKESAALSVGLLFADKVLAMAAGAPVSSKPTGDGKQFDNKASLKGFIVSDAHFGWISPVQPEPEKQRELMNVIQNRMPDLDLFVDTGDAHHDYAYDQARGDWTDVVANGCRTTPFFFCVGNHENHNSLTVDNKFFDCDTEFRSNKLGSVECQPYFSFDIKNIHFICLPQLMDQGYITDAEIAWLKLDLDINKDKTTIIFSHNSLKGTTLYFSDIGYRVTTNSGVLLELFKKYPQVIAWMHGHNHTYEVVPIAGTVYVSNGRFGGFDPKFKDAITLDYGSGNLGGIFFEVTKDSFYVRCYSAEKEKFFDEILPSTTLTHRLERSTSLDINAPSATSYGFGGAPNGQKIQAYHHTVGGKRELFITGAENPVINENSEFKVYTQREGGNWQTKHLSGYSFEPNEEDFQKIDRAWEWIDPAGVRILKRNDLKSTKAIFAPNDTLAQRAYFRCAPGQKYKLTVVLDANSGGQSAQPTCRLFEKHFVKIFQDFGPKSDLKGGRQTLTWNFEIPPLANIDTVYSNPDSDNDMMLTVGVIFGNVGSNIDISSFRLTIADASDGAKTVNPTVKIDGKPYSYKGTLDFGQIKNFEIKEQAPYRSLYEFDVQGNRRVTWIERQSAPKFQVRGATAAYVGDELVVGPLRNHFSAEEEVVIVPMAKYDLPYVHRIYHAEYVYIKEATKGKVEIDIRVNDDLWVWPQASAVIACTAPPRKVEGSSPKKYSFKDNRFTLKLERNGKYKLIW